MDVPAKQYLIRTIRCKYLMVRFARSNDMVSPARFSPRLMERHWALRSFRVSPQNGPLTVFCGINHPPMGGDGSPDSLMVIKVSMARGRERNHEARTIMYTRARYTSYTKTPCRNRGPFGPLTLGRNDIKHLHTNNGPFRGGPLCPIGHETKDLKRPQGVSFHHDKNT